MNRREFLEGLIAAGVDVTAAPALLYNTNPGVKEYGYGITVPPELHFELRIFEFLRAHAKQHLPSGTKYELREGLATDFGRMRSFGYYATVPSMIEFHSTGYHHDMGVTIIEGGIA